MTPKEYRKQMWQFAVYPNRGNNPLYAELGLLSEIGELAGEAKRVIRDDGGELTPERREKMIDELGDIMWYLAAISHEISSEDFLTSLEDIQRHSPKISGEVREPPKNVNEFLSRINKLPDILYTEDSQSKKFYLELKGLIEYLDTTLEEVLRRNVDKLQSRMKRNKIKGEGGDR